jgi:hypothetical protein
MAAEQMGIRENTKIQEIGMKTAFAVEVAKILMHKDRFTKAPGRMKIGFEMEASLIDEIGQPVTEQVRDAIRETVPSADPELGAAQIEWRTDPIELNADGGLRQLVDQAVSRDAQMRDAAASHGAKVLRLGTQPLIAVSEVERTNKQKYKEVPDFHNRKRTRTNTAIGPNNERVDLNDASVVALLNSLQCNLEAESLEDAVDLTNRSLMIGPLMVALSGNARFLEGKDTTFNDVRATAWETSHDTRTEAERHAGKGLRIGLPVDYFSDMKDYFKRVGSHPFILNDAKNALRIGIGLFWQDTRIKIIGDSAVVEFRPVSIQPSVQEDIAVMLFYLGRLEWSKMTNEKLMPIEEVRERRAMAMMIGISPFLNELPDELEKAFATLEHRGLAHDELLPFFDILKQRVIDGQTPADVFAGRVHSFRGEREDAIKNAIGI